MDVAWFIDDPEVASEVRRRWLEWFEENRGQILKSKE